MYVLLPNTVLLMIYFLHFFRNPFQEAQKNTINPFCPAIPDLSPAYKILAWSQNTWISSTIRAKQILFNYPSVHFSEPSLWTFTNIIYNLMLDTLFIISCCLSALNNWSNFHNQIRLKMNLFHLKKNIYIYIGRRRQW